MNEWKTTVFLLCAAAVGLLLKARFNKWPSLKDRNLSWRELETELSDVNALLGHHLRRSVEPFLSANISLSEETFNWWKVSCHTFTRVVPCKNLSVYFIFFAGLVWQQTLCDIYVSNYSVRSMTSTAINQQCRSCLRYSHPLPKPIP